MSEPGELLNWSARKCYPAEGATLRRKVVPGCYHRFGREFPEITYGLLWESPTVNAQAWRLGSARYVRVYGGLVRHQAITKYGLALMLAHETGHHLGGLPRDPAMPWMTWQGQADYWAAKCCDAEDLGASGAWSDVTGRPGRSSNYIECLRASSRMTSPICRRIADIAYCARERSARHAQLRVRGLLASILDDSLELER